MRESGDGLGESPDLVCSLLSHRSGYGVGWAAWESILLGGTGCRRSNCTCFHWDNCAAVPTAQGVTPRVLSEGWTAFCGGGGGVRRGSCSGHY